MSDTATLDDPNLNGEKPSSPIENGEVEQTNPVDILTVDSLHEALSDAGYICDRDRARAIYAALQTDPLGGMFAFGPPGTGKTWLFEVLADVLEMEHFFRQVTPGTREEDLILDLLPDEDKTSGIKKQHGVLVDAVRASQDGPVLLTLDEWDKTRPTADAFLLDFLQTGRINYGDIHEQADMDNLYVGITLNEERDLSGPLHRRLPFLQFDPLHPTLVRKALIGSHGTHPYIEAAVNLYVRVELSMMDKPATIQELQQLLDATTRLGDEADWDSLVYQYVTKDRNNHHLLAKAESKEIGDWEEDMSDKDVLDPTAYGEVDMDGDIKGSGPSDMPRMADMKGYTGKTENDRSPDLASSYAAFTKNREVYNDLTKVEEAGEEPEEFGRVSVEGETITFDEPIDLIDHDQYANDLWGHPGEMVFVAESATKADMRILQQERGLNFTSYTENEIIGRKDNVHVRWAEGEGAEVIVRSDAPDEFSNMFVGTWVADTIHEGYDLPPRAMARMGMKSVGTVEASERGYEIAEPFSAGLFDEWQATGVDFCDATDIPGYNSFLQFAEKSGEVKMVGDSMYVYFDGLMIGFLGEDNDHFAYSVTGAFDPDLDEYLQDWLPGSKMFLAKKRGSAFDEEALLKDHGFSLPRASKKRKNPSRTLHRMKGGIKSVYQDGSLRVGAQLTGEKITSKRVKVIAKRIEETLRELT
jgi:MoxR-like ATPase/acetone carboxylase gamma subunit